MKDYECELEFQSFAKVKIRAISAEVAAEIVKDWINTRPSGWWDQHIERVDVAFVEVIDV